MSDERGHRAYDRKVDGETQHIDASGDPRYRDVRAFYDRHPELAAASIEDSEIWEASVAHLGPEARELHEEIARHSYAARKERSEKAAERAKQHALAAEQVRRGLLGYKPQQEPHAKREVPYDIKLKDPDVDQVDEEIENLNTLKGDLEQERREQTARLHKLVTKLQPQAEQMDKEVAARHKELIEAHPEEDPGALKLAARHEILKKYPHYTDKRLEIVAQRSRVARIDQSIEDKTKQVQHRTRESRTLHRGKDTLNGLYPHEIRRVHRLLRKMDLPYENKIPTKVDAKHFAKLTMREQKEWQGYLDHVGIRPQERSLTPPTPEQVARKKQEIKDNVSQLNRLRKEMQTRDLQPWEVRRLHELAAKERTQYNLVDVDKEGKSADEKERVRIETEADRAFPVGEGREGLRPKKSGLRVNALGYPLLDEDENEDAEYIIGEHGQENARLGPIEGWKATTKFQREQSKRTLNAIRTGEGALGWKGRGQGWTAPDKAKYTMGPNKDVLLRTAQWSPIAPPVDDKKVAKLDKALRNARSNDEREKLQGQLRAIQHPMEFGQDRFHVELEHQAAPENDYDEHGNWITQGENINQTIRDLGLSDRVHVQRKGRDSKNWSIHTSQGEHLNPDEIASVQAALHKHHGLKSFDTEKSIQFKRKTERVPVGANRIPLKDKEILSSAYSKNLYSRPVGSRLGERNAITGDLEEGQKDSLGIRLPGFSVRGHQFGERTLQRHFNESTDAIGWGTSYRPGEKEVGAVLTAIPRARRERELNEAWESSLKGDDSQMTDFMSKYYPDVDKDLDSGDYQDKRNKLLTEARLLSSSGASAAYYAHRRGLFARSLNRAYRAGSRIPGAGPGVERVGRWLTDPDEYGNLVHDANYGLRLPLLAKIERAKTRAQHPFRALTPEGKPDYTVPGIINSENERRVTVNVPPWRYRKHFIDPQERFVREKGRQASRVEQAVAARENVAKRLEDPNLSRAKRWLAVREANVSMFADETTKAWQNKAETTLNEIDQALSTADKHGYIRIAGKEYHTKHNGRDKMEPIYPSLERDLRAHKEEIEGAIERSKKVDKEALRHTVAKYYEEHPGELPKAVKTAGKFSLLGAAAVGGGVLAVDKYQVYRRNKGEKVSHPLLKTVVPEKIVLPKVFGYRTQEYVIPHNSFTDALDIQGEKFPTKGRVGVKLDQKVRLQHHKDVSGESYKNNLPLLGGIGVLKPAKPGGSIKDSLVTPGPKSELGNAKNLYVKGKKVPVDISVGKKERWSDRQHNLKAKYNHYKLSNQDREKLVALAGNPGSNVSKEDITSFYPDDEKLHDSFEDKKEYDRIMRKNIYGQKQARSRKVFVPGETSEQTLAHRRIDRSSRQDQRRAAEEQRREGI